MGFPITAEVVHGGRHDDFPLFVWFIDHPDGPVWEEMDEALEDWDARTGPDLAFFVDPFQREQWAAEFFRRVVDADAVHSLLGARRQAQWLFRSRLADRACGELWIPKNKLPVAIIGCRWDARATLACPLSDRQGVRRALDELTKVGRHLKSQAPHARRRSPVDLRLGHVARALGRAGFSYRRVGIQRSALSGFARNSVVELAFGPFMRWLLDQGEAGSRRHNVHFAALATRVVFSSLDDVLAIA